MRPNKGIIFFSLLIITILSLVTIWSTTPNLLTAQLAAAVFGAVIIMVLSRSDADLIFSFYWASYAISIILLLLTFFLGSNVRGSVRWINLGLFNLQTSEIAKPLLIIFFSQYLTKNPVKNYKQLFIYLILTIVPVLMVLKQPDLGSALSLAVIPVSLLVVSGHFKKMLILAVLSISLIVPFHNKFLKPYQLERIESFINPYKDPQGSGYNVIQATIAIGSGGIFGKGVRLGTQSHLNFLPERHTDFIFASFSEEFGLIGILLLTGSYFALLRYLLKIAPLFKTPSHYYFTIATFFLLLFQITINMGMNLGVMPVTGITLPIFSYGGSSLISLAILFGIQLKLLDLIAPFEI